MLSRLTRLSLFGFLLLTMTTVSAQPIRIGVVVDRTGPGADPAMEAAISFFEARMQRSGGVFGALLEVLVRDGRGDPTRTRTEVERLIVEDEAHVVVCCSGVPLAREVAGVAADHETLVLALASPPADEAGWLYGLGPSERTELRAIVSHEFNGGTFSFALMTLDNAFGDPPTLVLEQELGVAGMALLAVERYPPDTTVLTPEALWVATRQPGAVVIWGLARDTEVAVDALQRRGWEGPIYARSALIGTLTTPNVRFAAAPIQVDDAPDPGASAVGLAAELADALFGLYGLRDVTPTAARAYDALELLYRAAEQASLYGVSPDEVLSYRQALRDAAIALPIFQGAGGEYDLSERSNQAALPSGLVVVEVRGGRLVGVQR